MKLGKRPARVPKLITVLNVNMQIGVERWVNGVGLRAGVGGDARIKDRKFNRSSQTKLHQRSRFSPPKP
jgi:hypothetical protein